MKPLCVIPARLGSKRLQRKNLAPLVRKPLIAYSIEAAIRSGLFSTVYVSTESPEVRDIAEEYGARVNGLRPEELAGDTVSNVAACLHLYEQLVSAGETYDAVFCLQPSSPLRSADDIVDSWRAFCRGNWDFLVSVTPVDPHFFHWAMEEREGHWNMFFGDRFLLPRQRLPPVFRPNGAIKIGRPRPLSERNAFFGPKQTVFKMPEERSVHVATATDLALAEAYLAGGS